MVPGVEAEKHGLVLKEVSHLSRQYPALLSGELVNKLAALAVHATTRTAVADLRNEYNLARVDRSLEKLTVDRGWRQNNSKENSTVTIVSVSGEAVRRGQDVQGRDIQRGTEVAVVQPPYPHAVNSSSSNSSSSTTTATTTATASSAPYTVPTAGGGLSSHVIRQGGQYHCILKFTKLTRFIYTVPVPFKTECCSTKIARVFNFWYLRTVLFNITNGGCSECINGKFCKHLIQCPGARFGSAGSVVCWPPGSGYVIIVRFSVPGPDPSINKQ